MTTFNIDTFINNLNRNGTLQTNKYEVRIAKPRLIANNQAIFEQMKYRAESVKIPGITFETTDSRRYGHDIRQKVTTGANFNDIGITFIEQDMNTISRFFYFWMNLIYGSLGGNENFNLSIGNQTASRKPSAIVEYKDYYSTRIEIDVFNNNGQLTMAVILEDAFPVSMGDVSLGWSDRNSLYKLNVSFAYSYISIYRQREQPDIGYHQDTYNRPWPNTAPLPTVPSI